jgi:ParB/RepB/Spo0J family partition protein
MQPRTDWPPESLEELARSIKARGLLEPIIVRPSGSKYEVIAGERRWRACRIAGLGEIPSLVRTMSDHESLETALVENIQRSDLNPIDEARAYKALATEYELTHDDIAQRVGKDRSTVSSMYPRTSRVPLPSEWPRRVGRSGRQRPGRVVEPKVEPRVHGPDPEARGNQHTSSGSRNSFVSTSGRRSESEPAGEAAAWRSATRTTKI